MPHDIYAFLSLANVFPSNQKPNFPYEKQPVLKEIGFPHLGKKLIKRLWCTYRTYIIEKPALIAIYDL